MISIFFFVYSVNDDTLKQLCDKLSRKNSVEFHNKRVGPGWIKYSWHGTIWNLDDGAR